MPQPCTEGYTKELLELGANVITWLLVIVGWMVVNDQNESREVAKIGHSRINEARARFKEIERLAVKFHTGPYGRHEMHALMRLISQATLEMSHLRKHGFIGLGTSEHASAVRKAITNKNFDEANHAELDPNADFILEIEAACSQVDRELLDSAHNISRAPRTLVASCSAVFKRLV